MSTTVEVKKNTAKVLEDSKRKYGARPAKASVKSVSYG